MPPRIGRYWFDAWSPLVGGEMATRLTRLSNLRTVRLLLIPLFLICTVPYQLTQDPSLAVLATVAAIVFIVGAIVLTVAYQVGIRREGKLLADSLAEAGLAADHPGLRSTLAFDAWRGNRRLSREQVIEAASRTGG